MFYLLQALTLVCNTNNNGKKWFDLSGMADVIVSHRDFVQMLVSLLSGSGVAFSEKGAVSQFFHAFFKCLT